MDDPSHESATSNPLDNFSFGDPFKTWWPFIIAIVVGIVTTIRGFVGGPPCPSDAEIRGKTVVVTGGSGGIGLEVVLELLKRGARVIVGARREVETMERFKKLLKEKKIVRIDQLDVQHLDLSSLVSVRKFVDLLGESEVDILINNGGVAFQMFHLTEEGFETHYVTNYLSHFLLTHLLLPKLKSAKGGGRIINVSAQAHYLGDINMEDLNLQSNYTSNKAYGQSKLALVLMMKHLANTLQGSNVTINTMHPGIVRGTNHMRDSVLHQSSFMHWATLPWTWLFMKNAQQGAQTIIYMAVEPSLSTVSGKYFSNCAEIEPSERINDEVVVEQLYRKSSEQTGL